MSITLYDGYGTPSMEFVAYKKSRDYKVHFYAANDDKFPSTRLRCVNISNWLKRQGIECYVGPEQKMGYDIVVFKQFRQHDLEFMKRKKEKGRKVYVDLSEDILDNQIVIEMVKLADKVLCCSDWLREKVSLINENAIEINEAFE